MLLSNILALTGLCPSFNRSSSNKSAKSAFAKKLMPTDSDSPGYPRTLTAYLLYNNSPIKATNRFRAN